MIKINKVHFKSKSFKHIKPNPLVMCVCVCVYNTICVDTETLNKRVSKMHYYCYY